MLPHLSSNLVTNPSPCGIHLIAFSSNTLIFVRNEGFHMSIARCLLNLRLEGILNVRRPRKINFLDVMSA